MFKNHKKIVITGSGNSMSQFTQPDPDWTILCVNNSINHPNVERADYWFTLDLSYENRDIILNQHPDTKKYVAHSKDPRITEKMIKLLSEKCEILERVAGKGHDSHSCHFGMQEEPTKISTGNSVYGALNLAYHMKPEVIVFIGLDAQPDRMKFDGKCCRSLAHLPYLFATALPQLNKAGIKVINGNSYSAIECFPRMEFDKAINSVDN